MPRAGYFYTFYDEIHFASSLEISVEVQNKTRKTSKKKPLSSLLQLGARAISMYCVFIPYPRAMNNRVKAVAVTRSSEEFAFKMTIWCLVETFVRLFPS